MEHVQVNFSLDLTYFFGTEFFGHWNWNFHKIVPIDCKLVGTCPSQLLEPTDIVFVTLCSNFSNFGENGESGQGIAKTLVNFPLFWYTNTACSVGVIRHIEDHFYIEKQSFLSEVLC